jgi:uncharacterized protein
MIKQEIEDDLKKAMLAGDKRLVTVLRTIKGAILDVEIAKNCRDTGLPDEEVVALLQKESKKRGEAAVLYSSGNDAERAASERYEQDVLAKYLPKQLEEAEISKIIDTVISEVGEADIQQMGKIIGAVKAKTGPSADGAVIARLVKERLTK